jgi:hypothetical protein
MPPMTLVVLPAEHHDIQGALHALALPPATALYTAKTSFTKEAAPEENNDDFLWGHIVQPDGLRFSSTLT